MSIEKEKKENYLKLNHKIKRIKKLNQIPTKVIIRHLPPTLTSEKFIEQVSPIPDHNYYYFVKGDLTLGSFSYSRAYINFINQEDILTFKEKFDNYVFIGDKGNEYPAIVEFAIYQDVPKRKKKIDSRCNTIEQDPNFIKFVFNNQNNRNEENLPTVEDCLEEIEAKEKEHKASQKISTPLLEFIKQKKIEKHKSREEKLKEDRLDKKKKNDDLSIKKKPSYFKIKQRNKEWSEINLKREKDLNKRDRKKRLNYKLDDILKQNDQFNKNEKNININNKNIENKSNKTAYNDLKDSKNIKSEYSNFKKDRYKNERENDEGSTFTVKILTNSHRQENQDKKSSKLNENNREKPVEDKKIKNKDRPSIEIYRPKRITVSSKEITDNQKSVKKSNQETLLKKNAKNFSTTKTN